MRGSKGAKNSSVAASTTPAPSQCRRIACLSKAHPAHRRIAQPARCTTFFLLFIRPWYHLLPSCQSPNHRAQLQQIFSKPRILGI